LRILKNTKEMEKRKKHCRQYREHETVRLLNFSRPCPFVFVVKVDVMQGGALRSEEGKVT
jgi:hypothetical protein